VLAPAYWIGNQAIVQRCLGARSEFEAKASFMWGAILKTFIPFIMVVPGILALAHNPNIPDADQALPILIRDVLPVGVLGIFFAAFLAALMSSVDSCLNSAATLITKDVYEQYIHPHASDRHYLIVGRIVTILAIVFAVYFAIWVQRESIYAMIQTLLSIFQGPSLAIILLGVLWWRTTGIGAFAGLVGGIAFSCSLTLINNYAAQPIFQIQDPFLYIAWWSFVFALILTAAVSLLTPPEPQEKLAGLVHRYVMRDDYAKSR